MPANKKYLTNTLLDKIVKLITGIVGGYVITIYFFSLLAHFLHVGNTLVTLRFAGFMMWVTLIILAFLARNSWKIAGIYTIVILFLITVNYFI